MNDLEEIFSRVQGALPPKEVHRRLMAIASLYDAEHIATDILYYTQIDSYHFRDPRTENASKHKVFYEALEYLINNYDKPYVWKYLRDLLENNHNRYQGTIFLYAALSGDVLEQLVDTFSYEFIVKNIDNVVWNIMARSRIDSWTPTSRINQYDPYLFEPLSFEDQYTAYLGAFKNKINWHEKTLHEVPEDFLDQLVLDDFIVDQMLDEKELFLEALSTCSNFATGNKDFEEEKDIHCLRFTEVLPNGKTQLVGFCFLSLFYKRLGWILRDDSVETIQARNRCGGKIGSQRSPAKNLEILSSSL